MKSSTSTVLSMLGAGLLQFSAIAQAANCSSPSYGPPTVSTLNGSFYGSHNARYNVDSFLGLPYVQPPVGDLRYRAPQALNTSWTGLKNATQYGYRCVGYDGAWMSTPMSEDCLTLNVVRPSGFDDEELPVAVWIHGGNYQYGSSSNPSYNLTWIVQASVEAGNPMIGVSINYRLHTWGFLFSQELKDEKAGNLGLKDQRAALEWIQDNIGSFGGDPSKVTLWGESAGAGSIGAQLVAYNGTDSGLFRAAIMESGASVSWSQYGNMTKYQTMYDAITNSTGCGDSINTLQCLRELPFETLNTVLNSSVTSADLQYPVIDDDFLLQSASSQLQNGQFVKVPILIGTNFDEGASFSPHTINTTSDFRSYLTADGITTVPAAVDALTLLYPDLPAIGIPATVSARVPALGLQYKRIAALIGDALMHAPRRFTNEIWAKNNISSWSYHFNVVPANFAWTVGSGHASELAFVFGDVEGVGYSPSPFANKSDTYKQLARLMTRQWSSFVVNLDPNDSGVPSPTWPAYNLEAPYNYVYDANMTALAYLEPDTFRAEAIDYFNQNWVSLFGR